MPTERDRSSEDAATESSEASQHWLAGKDVETLFYKVNRRAPVSGETIFPPPASVLDHLEEVLRAPIAVESGRRFKRT